jgi:hypothetical protein
MGRILFKFHLVPLVLVEIICMQEIYQNLTKMVTIWTYEASGHGRRPWAHLSLPPGANRASPDPQVAIPCQ